MWFQQWCSGRLLFCWLGWLSYVAYLGSALGAEVYFRSVHEFMWMGLITGVLAIVLRIRGHRVRQFGLAVVSLVVSVLSVAQWGYMTWVFWQLPARS